MNIGGTLAETSVTINRERVRRLEVQRNTLSAAATTEKTILYSTPCRLQYTVQITVAAVSPRRTAYCGATFDTVLNH